MALATYSDLVTAIGAWLNRGTDYDAMVPQFIALAEAEFNRTLRTAEMETRTTATLSSDNTAVPTDMIGVISLKLANTRLDYVAPGEAFDDEATGTPDRYTINRGKFYFRPAPTSGTVTVDYYAKIPGLTVSNTTNWLMTKHPDLYLFACLAQAEFYGWNDARLPLVKARVEEIMAQIEGSAATEKFGGHRLAPSLNIPSV